MSENPRDPKNEATTEVLSITDGLAVVIGYELKLNNGEVVDSCDQNDPLTFIFGAGQMLPAFEAKLKGKKKGDRLGFALAPEDGYGKRSEEAVMQMPKTMFPEHVSVGMIFEAETPEGEQALLRVTKVADADVTVDANHPMAGETLNFSVEVLEVRPPLPGEDDDDFDDDHEHGPGCSHHHH